MKEIASLTSLEELEISYAPLDDAGLQALAGMKNLRKLTVSTTNVTDAGVGDLKKALPGCEIVRH